LIVLAALIALIPALACAEPAQPATSSGAVSFYQKVMGDWVGTYHHTTDGEEAEDICFRFCVKQEAPSSFTGEFSYFRQNEVTGEPIPAGTAVIKSTIQADGSIKNIISGKGTIRIDQKLKPQTYDLVETLCKSDCGLSGDISGKVSVSDLPFGLGKNGKVNRGFSAWSLKDGVLTIEQDIKAGFKILLFSKSYSLVATTKATRGTDVAALMKKVRIAEKPAGPIPEHR